MMMGVTAYTPMLPAASLAGQSRETGVVRRGGGLGQAGEDMVVGGRAAGFRWAMEVVG